MSGKVEWNGSLMGRLERVSVGAQVLVMCCFRGVGRFVLRYQIFWTMSKALSLRSANRISVSMISSTQRFILSLFCLTSGHGEDEPSCQVRWVGQRQAKDK